MANSLLSQKYIESCISEILTFPEIQNAIQHPTRVLVSSDQPMARVMWDEEYLFKTWLIGQFERYVKVYDTISEYFKKEGKILPAEPKDFMKWYVNNVIAKGDYLTEQIEATDFNLYHEEMLKTLNKTNKWNDLYRELSENGYIYTTPEVFNYVIEFKLLPVGREKIPWRTSKVDALDFQANFGFTIPQFNKCFYHTKTGTPFTAGIKSGSKLLGYRNEELASIIEKYSPITSK